MGKIAGFEYESSPQAARQARAFVTARLISWDADHLVQVASLCVSELATNAIVHAGTPFRLSMTLDLMELLVEVHDGSPTPPRLQRLPDGATHGRGLRMVEAMASDWGWEPTQTGKVVWFRTG